jgi:type II secretory pathway pseudopilin PulG
LTRAITLVEILVVIAIILIVSAIAWMALGPAAKVKSMEARVTSDLKQISTAFNIYMGEYDDNPPLGFQSIPHAPSKLAGWKTGKSINKANKPSAAQCTDDYTLTYNYPMMLIEQKHPVKYRFEADEYGIAFAPQIVWPDAETIELDQLMEDDDGSRVRMSYKQSVPKYLTAFLDGHVTWSIEPNQWSNEVRLWNSYGR